MIPLIVTGAAYLASDVVDAWKSHMETAAMTQAAKSADFQLSLKQAATKLAAAGQQQNIQNLPADLNTVTEEILQAPGVQSMAHSSPTAAVNLEFNSSGDVFAAQTGGGFQQILVSPDVRQQLQQLNTTMRGPGAGGTIAHINGEIASIHLPVQVNLSAV